MLYVILILFIIAITAGHISSMKKDRPISNETESEEPIQPKKEYDDYYVGCKIISLYARKGYRKFQIAGVYYRNLPIEIIGKFDGSALAEEHNKHDPYAIAIYNDEGIHLGYLPRGNATLHAYILNNGGNVHAYGYLGYDDGMYGETCVETNKELVTKRNKPYCVD